LWKHWAASGTDLPIRQIDVVNYARTRARSEFIASDNASTTTERGRILERLVVYLFSKCAGVRHFQSNAINAAGSGEIDVCFWNERYEGSIDFLPRILIVECKNTVDRVDSASVRVFLSKLHEMRLDYGILIAANGVTGDAENLRAAHDVIRTAFQRDGVRIIVLTRSELVMIRSTEGLIRLLQDKILMLTMQAHTF
jgi:Restriction endonuclease